MGKIRGVIGLVFMFSSVVFSQEIDTDIYNKKVSFFVEKEKMLKSQLYDSGVTHVSLDGSAQPIIFRRKEKNIPDLLVEYSFSKKDSILNSVLYEWDVINFEKGDNNVKTIKFSKAIIEKYNSLLKLISKEFGESKSEGSLEDLSKIDVKGGLKRNDVWTKDGIEIQMYTAISNFYQKSGIITISPTHRIRLYVRTVKSKEASEVDESRVVASDLIFSKFISALKVDDLKTSKDYLSDFVLETISDDQLVALAKQINFTDKPVIYFKGHYLTTMGEKYLMIQYRYENDTAEVPLKLIKVFFDSDDKIIGIQPIVRQ